MCGIIGVSGIPDAARLAYLGLYALQHRGQESAGIVAVDRDGHRPRPPRHGSGRRKLRRAASWPSFPATSRSATPATPPPAARSWPTPSPASSTTRCGAAGASPTTATSPTPTELKRELVERGAIFTTSADTEVLVHLIARSEADTVEDQIREALERVEGAYSLVITVGRTMYAVVDSRGFRPLVLGRLGGGMVVASETCALDLVGATYPASSSPASSSGSRTARSPTCPGSRPGR